MAPSVYQDTIEKRLPVDCTTRRGYRQHQELLQRELGQWAAGGEMSLAPMHQRIVHALHWLDLHVLLGYSGKRPGAPERSRLALAQAFMACSGWARPGSCESDCWPMRPAADCF